MIKNTSAVIFLLFFSFVCYTQSPFNKIYDLGYIHQNAFILEEYNEEIYVVGQLRRREPEVEVSIFYSKFDLNGTLLDTTSYKNTSGNGLFMNNVNELLKVGDNLYSAPFGENSLILKSDLKLDSVILVSEFDDPLLPEIPNILTSIVQFPKGFISVSGVSYTGPTERRGLLAKIDLENDFETTVGYIDFGEIRLTPYKLFNFDKNKLLSIGYADDTRIASSLSEANFGVYAILYDEDYNVLYSNLYEEANHSGVFFDAMLDSDSNVLMCATEFIRDTTSFQPIQTRVLFRSSVVKLDSQLNYQWTKALGQQSFKENYDIYQGICESHDKDGYIIVGESGDEGTYMKMGTEGDSLWYRKITTLEENDNDALWDVIATSDGNYMATGLRFRTTENDSISSVSQLWLIKFDENGDIIDLSTSTDNSITLDIDVKIFPNPSSELVYIEQKEVDNLQYRLYDSSGKLLVSRNNSGAYHTFVLDVSYYESGNYYLEIVDSDTGRRYVKELIVL